MKTIKLIVLYFLCSLLLSCSGGTRGTGGKVFSGTIKRTGTDLPFENLEVTILESGITVTTDENGMYTIEGDVSDFDIDFLFETEDFSVSSAEIKVSPNSDRITINFEIDDGGENVIPTLIEEFDEDPDVDEEEELDDTEEEPVEDETNAED